MTLLLFAFRTQHWYSAPAAALRMALGDNQEVGQNSKQEKSQWQLVASAASGTVNYANELIRKSGED